MQRKLLYVAECKGLVFDTDARVISSAVTPSALWWAAVWCAAVVWVWFFVVARFVADIGMAASRKHANIRNMFFDIGNRRMYKGSENEAGVKGLAVQ